MSKLSALTTSAGQPSPIARLVPKLPLNPGDKISLSDGSEGVLLDKAKIGGLNSLPQDRVDFLAVAHLLMKDAKPSGISDDDASNLYAEVVVGGKVVASVYNGGSLVTTNGSASAIADMNEPDLEGPDLAQWRASTLAKALGGMANIASTALRQDEWQPRSGSVREFTREDHDKALIDMKEFGLKQAEIRRQSAYQAASNLFIAQLTELLDKVS